MKTGANWQELIDKLKSRIAEIKADKSLHPEMVEKLEGAVAELEAGAVDFDQIKSVADAIENRLLDPVRRAQRVGNRIGFLFGLTGIVVSIVAVVYTARISKSTSQEVKTFTESSFVELLETRAGHKAIAEEVAKSVLDSDLYYSEYLYDATLEHLADRDVRRWTEEQMQTYLMVKAEMRKVVQNPTDQTKRVPLGIQFFNLDAPDPEPGDERVIYEELQFESFDRMGIRVDIIQRYVRDELQKLVAGVTTPANSFPKTSRFFPADESRCACGRPHMRRCAMDRSRCWLSARLLP